MGKYLDLVGQVFGRLTALTQVIPPGGGRAKWICLCECGKRTLVDTGHLRSGHTTSCGCLQQERLLAANTKHGMYASPVYKVWNGMIQRCTNEHFNQYADYGGRGITVCPDWLIADNFLAWAKDKWKEGLQLDREDNDRGYSPENCRFVTRAVNSANQRKRKNNITGFTGVHFNLKSRKYESRLSTNFLGRFDTAAQAVAVRNTYIIQNSLTHKLQ